MAVNNIDEIRELAERLKKQMDAVGFDPSVVENRHTDIQFGSLEEQKMDLYLPSKGEGPFPLLVYIHGGGWYIGSRRACAMDVVLRVLNEGWAIMVPDYRLFPDVQFPEFIYDVKTALRFARANAEKYNLDPEKFVILGDSAGGHIALTVAFTNDRPEYEGEKYGWAGVSSAVQGVCSMYGLTILDGDEDEMFRQCGVNRVNFAPGGKGDIYEMVFGTDNKELRRLVSPLALVHKDIPPVFLQHGLADTLVPYLHSKVLAEHIEEVCGKERYDLTLYPGRGHADAAFKLEENHHELMQFLNKIK